MWASQRQREVFDERELNAGLDGSDLKDVVEVEHDGQEEASREKHDLN